MLDFITRFFRREETSKTLAKERLRLVLLSDRVALAPDAFDEMKGEMLAVIRRYLEIDERALDMHFESLERQFALLASIPVLKVKTPEAGGRWKGAPTPQTAMPTPAFANGETNGAVSAVAHDAVDVSAPVATNGATHASPSAPRRRRRRRRPQAAQASPDAPPEPPAPQPE